MRRTAVCLLALAAALFFLPSGRNIARGDELLRIESSINYSVDTEEPSVAVTWEISLENNDPSTQFGAGQVFFYEGLSLPVLTGATKVSAISGEGTQLFTAQSANESAVLDQVDVSFDHNLFFGDAYDFTLSYELPETRSDTLLVTEAYVYVPLIVLGDEASVTVDAPSESPWQPDLAAQDCALSGEELQCSGSDALYLAGLLEVIRPDLTSTIAFEAPLAEGNVSVSLTYFEGDDETAAHQRDVITGTLSLIEEAYGWPYPGPDSFTVTHGGRQKAFGYEGLADCGGERGCQIIISPVATDYTLVHELAHLWSGAYQTRWLSEGFAEWITYQVEGSVPGGLLQGEHIRLPAASTPLQLDDWGDPESIIGADEGYLELTQAGYDYSLRFIEELEDTVGADGLRAVNKAIAESSLPVESRRYMDFLEDVTGLNPDALFTLWVFPESYDSLIELRREARDRYASVAAELADGGFSDEPLTAIRENISEWRFDEAMVAMDQIETNLGRYAEIKSELDALLSDADALGLVVPESLSSALERWEFEEVEDLMTLTRQALGTYGRAVDRVNEPRSLWQKFGLIGDDPDGELDAAETAFESGAFSRSEEHSESAISMIDRASSAATRRVLVVAGILGAFVVAFGVAYVIAITRQQKFGEEG
jgi:hypothetical protein